MSKCLNWPSCETGTCGCREERLAARRADVWVSPVFWSVTAAVIAGLLFVLFMATTAGAHEAPTGWSYEPMCCSSTDCYPVKSSEVRETKEGYVLTTGEVIPYGDGRIKRSRDEFFHECKPGGWRESAHSFCLYVPDRGF